MSLINCEVPLTLSWSKNCVITRLEKKLVTVAQGGNPAVYNDSAITATFKIEDTKMYIPVVTLSTEKDNKLLGQLKTRFKRTITWNKYRLEMFNKTKNNNLNYLIDPTFTNLNRVFVLSFENGTDITSFEECYLRKVEIKDFNVVTDGKPFFVIPVKNKEEAYKAVIEMSKNNDYATGIIEL